MEFIELRSHPFWVGTQAHPEFKSRPERPAPLFLGLVQAALARAEGQVERSSAAAPERRVAFEAAPGDAREREAFATEDALDGSVPSGTTVGELARR